MGRGKETGREGGERGREEGRKGESGGEREREEGREREREGGRERERQSEEGERHLPISTQVQLAHQKTTPAYHDNSKHAVISLSHQKTDRYGNPNIF